MSSSSDEPLSSAIALGLSQTPIAPIAPVARRGHDALDATAAPWRRALVIADPKTGHGRARSVADELRRGLQQRGVHVDVHVMRGPGDARARLAAISADTELIVAAGDADTLAEVLSGWPGADFALACLPLDGPSERVLGRLKKELGLARDVDGALETLMERRARAFPFLRVGRHAGLASLRVEAPDAAHPLTLRIDGSSRPDRYRRVRLEREVSRWPRPQTADLGFRIETIAARARGLARWRARREGLGPSRLTIDCTRPTEVRLDGRVHGKTPVELDVETTSRLLVP